MISLSRLSVDQVPGPGQSQVRVDVANLRDQDRSLLATVIAMACDPEMAPMRDLFMEGKLVLAAEDGEIGLVTAATRTFARG